MLSRVTPARAVARGLTRPRPAGALAGNPAPSQVPAGAVASREVPGSAQPSQGQAPPGSPRRALTRLALAGSGDSGRPGRARSACQLTANPAFPAVRVRRAGP